MESNSPLNPYNFLNQGAYLSDPEECYSPLTGDATRRSIVRKEGYLTYRFAPGGTCEMVDMAVDNNYRRQGIATEMMEQIARMPQVRVLYGFMRETNGAVQDWYLANGFTLTKIPDFYGPGEGGILGLKYVGEVST